MSQVGYKYSYDFQKKDDRDFKYAVVENTDVSNHQLQVTKKGNTQISNLSKLSIPSKFQISYSPPILSQGWLGSCVANAFSYNIANQTKSVLNISRLQLYALSRTIDFTPLNQDNGTTIRSACKALTVYGACQESVYPYVINNYKNLPPLNAFKNSNLFRNFTYLFINQDLSSLKTFLANNNKPIVFGIRVYSSFETSTVAKTGIVPMPNTSKEQYLGGHCICIVGYDDATQRFTCANSWGIGWGNKGYFYLPYNYVLSPNLAGDFCGAQFTY
jgi:C1A family cysteine protease